MLKIKTNLETKSQIRQKLEEYEKNIKNVKHAQIVINAKMLQTSKT